MINPSKADKKEIMLNMIKPLILSSTIFILAACSAQNNTSPKFKNHTKVDVRTYGAHKDTLTDSIKNLIINKTDPYYQKENDALTEIFIDTIIYSPAQDKFAFFSITKNSNDKLLSKGSNKEFHFNACCFIGRLNSNKNIKDISWVQAQVLSNYPNLSAASRRIREIYFNELNKRSNSTGKSTYLYNFDDIRFWNGPLWKVYYE